MVTRMLGRVTSLRLSRAGPAVPGRAKVIQSPRMAVNPPDGNRRDIGLMPFLLGSFRTREPRGIAAGRGRPPPRHLGKDGSLNKPVLVVDDEPVVANLIGRQIAADGYQVDIAGDGVEAVLKYIQKDYEFVVLDIAMPRLKGSDALRIMKAVKPHVPVVTVTGQVGRGEMAETVESGALACLAKPFTIQQLRDA